MIINGFKNRIRINVVANLKLKILLEIKKSKNTSIENNKNPKRLKLNGFFPNNKNAKEVRI